MPRFIQSGLKGSSTRWIRPLVLLLCQPRVEVTLCFVYKVMGRTFHDRINTQLIYRFESAQVVAWRITKPQRNLFRFESHWLLFLIQLFLFFVVGGVGGSDFIILFISYFYLFIYFYYFFLLFIIPLTCIRHMYKISVTT